MGSGSPRWVPCDALQQTQLAELVYCNLHCKLHCKLHCTLQRIRKMSCRTAHYFAAGWVFKWVLLDALQHTQLAELPYCKLHCNLHCKLHCTLHCTLQRIRKMSCGAAHYFAAGWVFKWVLLDALQHTQLAELPYCKLHCNLHCKLHCTLHCTLQRIRKMSCGAAHYFARQGIITVHSRGQNPTCRISGKYILQFQRNTICNLTNV